MRSSALLILDLTGLDQHYRLDDQVVGFIVFTGIFGLCYCTETPGLYGDALCKLLYFIAIVLCVDTECWVCDL